MQAPTHLLTGILIEKSVRRIRPSAVRHAAVVLLGAASHVVLDKFARLTYHPSEPLLRDRFWICHYSTTMLSAAFLVKKWGRQHKLGMFSSVLPDFDWALVKGLKVISFGRRRCDRTILHDCGTRCVDALRLSHFFHKLPDWNLKPRSTLIEVALCGLLALGILGKGR